MEFEEKLALATAFNEKFLSLVQTLNDLSPAAGVAPTWDWLHVFSAVYHGDHTLYYPFIEAMARFVAHYKQHTAPGS